MIVSAYFKKVVALSILTAGFLVGAVEAKTYKISTPLPDGTFAVVALKKAGDSIFEKTGGRVKLKIYPGGVMGSDKAVLSKIRIGQLHGFLANGGAMAPFFKDSQIYNAPMKFKSFDEVDKIRPVMDPKIEKGFSENGWDTYGIIESGFAYAMSSRKILSIDDLKSSKLWLPANDPISEQVANVYGVPAIYLGIGDVLTALQTGAVDTIIAPPIAALTLQWYTKVKYVTDMPFMYTYTSLAMSKKYMDKMPAKDKAVVTEELRKASAAINAQNRADNLSAFTALSSQGLEMLKLSPDEEKSIETTSEAATKKLIEGGEFSQEIYNELNKMLAQ